MEMDGIVGATGFGVGGRGRRLRRKVADWPSTGNEGAGVCVLTRSPELAIPVDKDKRTTYDQLTKQWSQ